MLKKKLVKNYFVLCLLKQDLEHMSDHCSCQH
jgi:hypothetical protein